jgi:phosphoserine phosphatase RsbU/P
VRIFPKLRLPTHRHKSTSHRHVSDRRPTRKSAAPVRALDLSSAVRSASSVENLYEALVNSIAIAFSTPAVALFVRDDEDGSFPCRISLGNASDSGWQSNGLPILAADSFVVRRLKSLSAPLQIDPAELDLWKTAFSDAPRPMFEKRMLERDVLLRTRASLMIQLWTKGDLLGILSLGERGGLSPQEREMLNHVAGQLALVIENAKLLQRLVEHERLRAELAVAAEVQRSLLPAAGVTVAGLDLCGFCQPASHVGGDYYDFIPLADHRVGICVADVAGKGISAALLMSVVQASLRSQLFNTKEQVSTRDVVTMLNRLICTSVSNTRFVTCFYGQLDAANGKFRFVNAGHNPPLLLRRSPPPAQEPDFQALSSGGLVLGVFPDSDYEEEEVLLGPGDILVAYTDGVTEAMNVRQEEFTEARLRKAIVESSHQNANEIMANISSRVADWSKGAPQHDDITVIVLKVS